MQSLLLDTHIALWLDAGDARLEARTLRLIDSVWHRNGTIYLSAVSAWEISLLVDLGRIELDLPTDDWIERFLSRPGVEGVPLRHGEACRGYRSLQLEHRDPADRLLIATAIAQDCPLVTYDDRIARFAKKYGRQYRFSVST